MRKKIIGTCNFCMTTTFLRYELHAVKLMSFKGSFHPGTVDQLTGLCNHCFSLAVGHLPNPSVIPRCTSEAFPGHLLICSVSTDLSVLMFPIHVVSAPSSSPWHSVPEGCVCCRIC